jgi:hypothetical protein
MNYEEWSKSIEVDRTRSNFDTKFTNAGWHREGRGQDASFHRASQRSQPAAMTSPRAHRSIGFCGFSRFPRSQAKPTEEIITGLNDQKPGAVPDPGFIRLLKISRRKNRSNRLAGLFRLSYFRLRARVYAKAARPPTPASITVDGSGTADPLGTTRSLLIP